MHDCLSILWWQYLQRQNAARRQTVVTLQTRTTQLHSNATKIPAVQMVTSINVIVFKHYMYRISASGWTWNQIHEHTTYQITIWDTQQTPDSVVSVATFVTLLVLIDLIWSKARVLPVRLTMSVAIPHATRMVDAVSSKAQAWAKEKTDHEIIHSLPLNISWGFKWWNDFASNSKYKSVSQSLYSTKIRNILLINIWMLSRYRWLHSWHRI